MSEPQGGEPRWAFDEMSGLDGVVRQHYQAIQRWIDEMPADVLAAKKAEAELLYRRIGITFAVYGEGGDPERLIPFDVVPRMFTANEWTQLEAGLRQRVTALNSFLQDIYGQQEILAAGRIPRELVLLNDGFLPEMHHLTPPAGAFTHIAGVDIVRTGEDDFYVLEDNVRTPSGVSYMLESREVMMRLFTDLFETHPVAPVDQYPEELLNTLASCAPPGCNGEPTIVLLTPGRYNSAYYEHCFLSDLMGVELVEGQDLFVIDNVVYMRTTRGPQRVDIIYRRIDDDYLDALTFRPDSVLGVAGLFNAYRAGNVTIANAPGAGIADDKAIYSYVPDMIDFYLGEKPILNNVPTYRCGEPEDCGYVLDNLESLVVKEVHGSGGYGMLVGPRSTEGERAAYAERVKADPGQFIAQPTLALSTSPTFTDADIAPRHVDLRVFVLAGRDIRIVPGGLTRVALKEGSLVVNSSQGGGTKDTWVLR